jgi:hypothetical protein
MIWKFEAPTKEPQLKNVPQDGKNRPIGFPYRPATPRPQER